MGLGDSRVGGVPLFGNGLAFGWERQFIGAAFAVVSLIKGKSSFILLDLKVLQVILELTSFFFREKSRNK